MKGCADHAPARLAKRPAVSTQGVAEPKRAKIAHDFRTRCESLARRARDNFATRVEEVHEFVRRNEHLPKLESENKKEHLYATWLANLKKRAKVKPLSDDERKQLNKIPGMKGRLQEWDDFQGNKSFATHVEEVLEFVRRNEHLPKLESENSE